MAHDWHVEYYEQGVFEAGNSYFERLRRHLNELENEGWEIVSFDRGSSFLLAKRDKRT